MQEGPLPEMHTKALNELLFKIADDQLILGHRNSEWTGVGPLLEEDIAFSSMAQDKVGQSRVLYQLLHSLGEADPDTLAFMRNVEQYSCCRLVELPSGEYDFSLIRHFLFDHAELLRFEMLQNSSYAPLAAVARKMHGEIRYHVLHADIWIRRLGNAEPAVLNRMQKALDYAWPYALGVFETSVFEDDIIETGLFGGEEALKAAWLEKVKGLLAGTMLSVPENALPVFGGRKGSHTEYLQPLLSEMGEVFRLDPTAQW